MKTIFKKIIIAIITVEARLVLKHYKPRIIAVSGTVGKTSTKDMIYHVLSDRFNVRKTEKSLNSEFGIPLTILGHQSGWDSMSKWLKIVCSGFVQIFYSPNYPKWLVIETGVDRPRDMDKIAKFLKPEIAVVTTFGSVPAHVEFFDSPEDVMAEEGKLIDYVTENGAAVLNADDEDVLRLKGKSKVKTYTYGFKNEKSDILATNKSTVYENKKASGISFKAEYEGNTVPVQISKVLGDQFIYPALAAVTVAKILGISPVTSCARISSFVPAPGRMNLIPGMNNSTIIDDTYNSSPIAVEKALNALSDVNCDGNKIAILGDMLEIGRFSHSAHVKVGEQVAAAEIDYLITVGMRAEDIAVSANENGMAKKRIFRFKESSEAIETAQALIEEKEGSVVLAKASQGIRVEKIVKEIIENPSDSAKLLVRQEKEWLNR
jgi:UDP-N-acetylmuramoyl-tripeptide--D-alanyl-D-alanine ligase